jgi:hypothetical protein
MKTVYISTSFRQKLRKADDQIYTWFLRPWSHQAWTMSLRARCCFCAPRLRLAPSITVDILWWNIVPSWWLATPCSQKRPHRRAESSSNYEKWLVRPCSCSLALVELALHQRVSFNPDIEVEAELPRNYVPQIPQHRLSRPSDTQILSGWIRALAAWFHPPPSALIRGRVFDFGQLVRVMLPLSLPGRQLQCEYKV